MPQLGDQRQPHVRELLPTHRHQQGDQVVEVAVLEHEALRVLDQPGPVHRFEAGEDHDLRLRHGGADLHEHFLAGDVGQTEVEDDDVGYQRQREADGPSSVAGLADHLEPAVGAQRDAQQPADVADVVDQHHTDAG